MFLPKFIRIHQTKIVLDILMSIDFGPDDEGLPRISNNQKGAVQLKHSKQPQTTPNHLDMLYFRVGKDKEGSHW